MIVGDHVRGLRFFRYGLDLLFPAAQLSFAVEIVVAIVAVVAVEPVFVVAPVQANVAQVRGDVLGRRQRASQSGLVDIAESDVTAGE